MKRPIEIIDDFYTDEELNTLFKEISIGTNQLEFSPTCHLTVNFSNSLET